MAEENIKLRVDVDTQEGKKGLDELNEASKKAGKEVKNLQDQMNKETSFDDRLKALNNEVKNTPVNIRAMNKQIQEYQALAIEAGRTSPVGKAALQEAAALRDQYVDIQNEVKRLSNDGYQLQAALELGSSVVAGFTAVKGVTAAMGIESENLQKTLVQLQGAQAALVGIETIRKNLEKESTLVLVAKTVKEKAATIVTNGLKAAQAAFNAVLAANPIALLVVAIGAALVAFKDLRSAIMGVIEQALSPLKDLMVSIGLVESDTAKARRERHKQRIKQLEEQIETQKERVKIVQEEAKEVETRFRREQELASATGKSTIEIEGRKLEAVKENIRLQIIELEKLARIENALAEERLSRISGTGKFASKVKKAVTAQRDQANEAVKIAKEQYTEIEHQQTVHEAKKTKIAVDAAKKRADEELKAREQAQKDFEKRRAEEAKRTSSIERINVEEDNKWRQDQRDKEAQAWAEYYASLGAMSAENSKKQIEDEEKIADAKRQLLDNTLGAIAANLEEGSAAAKAVTAAQIAIDTYRGAQAAFASAAQSPFTSVFPAYPFIQAATAVAFGVANLRKALAVDPSGGSVSISGGGVSAPTASATAGVPIAPTAGSTIIGGEQEPVQVYVTEADISQTQNNVQGIVTQATI